MTIQAHVAPADGFVTRHPDRQFDALLVLSFGGPEKRDDVLPFLENVLRGRNVPRERLLVVAEHYYRFGGVSPINQQNRELIAALEAELKTHDIDLPIYFGNRNWHPLLPGTLQTMVDDGIRKALVFVTSAYSSYSGCRQYREDLFNSQQLVEGEAPELMLTRKFFNHPGWIETQCALIGRAREGKIDDPCESSHIVFVAHSIPAAMADHCHYVQQLEESARLIIRHSNWESGFSMAWQSRSGPANQPWLEPDINDHLKDLAEGGVGEVVIVPLGFLSDHMEVLHDLDTEAAATAREAGLNMVRCESAGTHPRFVSMIRELIQEHLDPSSTERPFLGEMGAPPDVCPPDCCLPGSGRPSPWQKSAR